MLYYISNQQYNLCHGSTTKKSLQIDDTDLSVGNYLFKNGGSIPWLWTELKALDTAFSTSISFSLSELNDTKTTLVKEDISNGYALIVETSSICPTQTPTQTITPSNSPTITPTKTPTCTPTNTATPTLTPSSPLNRYLYYISLDIENVCYNRGSVLVNPISLYDTNTTLEIGSYIYKNSSGSSRWLFSELVAKLGSSKQFYFIQAATGLLSTVISGAGGYAIVSEAGVLCPSMLLSNNRYNLCHTSSYVNIQISTKNLDLRNYIYKTNGIDHWTWTELKALDPSFDNAVHLYLKRITSSSIIRINQDIATDYAVITEITSICPTQTPTATRTPSVTPTNTSTVTQSNTATPTLTPSNTATPTLTPSNTPTPTSTITMSMSATPTITPSNSATNTPTNSQTSTSTPTNTPTNSETPTTTPTNTPSGTTTQTPSNTRTPTATPTSTVTATRTQTPSPTLTSTPTVTLTSTTTPTITPSRTRPLDIFFYYISDSNYNVCNDVISASVSIISVYDRDNVLQPNSFIYKNKEAGIKWTYNDLLVKIGSLASILYIREFTSGVISSIIEDGDGFAVIYEYNIPCLPK